MTGAHPRLIAALRLVVTVAALALVFRALGAGPILALLAQVSPLWVSVAVVALAAQIALSALRWQVTAGALGVPIGRGQALGEYWLSVLGNTLLPGGVLGDAGRIARMRNRAGLGLAAQSVVVERLAGQVALAMAAGAGAVAWFWPTPGALLGAVLGPVLLAWLGAVLKRAGHREAAPDRLTRALRPLHRAWLGAGVWRLQVGLSAAILACNLAGFWAAAQAVGLTLPPMAALYVLPLTLAAMLIPVTVNGWGLREGAAAALWPVTGVLATEAVAASVVFGLSALLAALPGLHVLQRTGRRV